MKLTKAQVLDGRNIPTLVFFEELEGELELFPLTDGQWAQIENMQMRGIDVNGIDFSEGGENALAKMPNIEFSVADVSRNSYEADVFAVVASLSGGEEKWSADDVRGMRPAGIVERIAEKVYELSNVEKETTEELQAKLGVEVSSFRP